jgi:hypothetical protein
LGHSNKPLLGQSALPLLFHPVQESSRRQHEGGARHAGGCESILVILPQDAQIVPVRNDEGLGAVKRLAPVREKVKLEESLRISRNLIVRSLIIKVEGVIEKLECTTIISAAQSRVFERIDVLQERLEMPLCHIQHARRLINVTQPMTTCPDAHPTKDRAALVQGGFVIALDCDGVLVTNQHVSWAG